MCSPPHGLQYIHLFSYILISFFIFFVFFFQVNDSVQVYIDEISSLKDAYEELKVKERQLINDMKKKGDLARMMLVEKDGIIEQLTKNNSEKNSYNSSSSIHGTNSTSNNSNNDINNSGNDNSNNNNNSNNTNSSKQNDNNSNKSNARHENNSLLTPSKSNNSITQITPIKHLSNKDNKNTDKNHDNENNTNNNNDYSMNDLSMSSYINDNEQQKQEQLIKYLKQAFCGFVKAKKGVEMEHLGI